MNKFTKIAAMLGLTILFLIAVSACKADKHGTEIGITKPSATGLSYKVTFEDQMNQLKQKEIELDSIMRVLEEKHEILSIKEDQLNKRNLELMNIKADLNSREITVKMFTNIAFSLLLIGLILLLVSLVILSRLNKSSFLNKFFEAKKEVKIDVEKNEEVKKDE